MNNPLLSTPWLVSFCEADEAAVNLVCFPHAGGGAVVFHPWSRELQPVAAVRAVVLPGRESRFREPAATSMDAVVWPIAEALATLPNTRPIVMFGHSLGALIAYEVARRMVASFRRGPAALIVSGRPAPHLPSRAPRLAHLQPRDVVFQVAELHGGIPTALLEEPDLVALMGTVLKGDLTILENYQYVPGPPLDCPLLAVGGSSDRLVSRVEVEGWHEHTKGDFSCAQLDGGHFYLHDRDSRRALLAEVRRRCMAVGGSRSSEKHGDLGSVHEG